MKNLTAILWRLRDLALSFGRPPYRYLTVCGVKSRGTYSLCKAIGKTTARNPPGGYVVFGPAGETFTFSRSFSGRQSANRYDPQLAKRIFARGC